jgi:hypothetical protein
MKVVSGRITLRGCGGERHGPPYDDLTICKTGQLHALYNRSDD